MFEAPCLCCTKIIYGKLTVLFAPSHKYSLFFIWFKIFVYAVLLELLQAGFYNLLHLKKIKCMWVRIFGHVESRVSQKNVFLISTLLMREN